MKSRVFAVAVLSAVALVPAANGMVRTHAGPLTTAPTVFVEIQVTISDTRITVRPGTANRGDEGRFVMRNVGAKAHTFTLGTTNRTGTHQTGFSRTLKPKTQQTLLLFLDYRGPLTYRSSLPADRAKPGMKGIFKIL